MSHFVGHVFVPSDISGDQNIYGYLEEVLEPYSENKQVDPYLSETLHAEDLDRIKEKIGEDIDPDPDLSEDMALLEYWYGGRVIKQVGPRDFEVYSTYNPNQYDLEVCTGHGIGSEEAQSAWHEVLCEVWGDQARHVFWKSDEGARRTFHLLQGVHEGEEQSENSGTSEGLAPQADVRNLAGGVQRHAGAAGREVRYLWDHPAGGETEREVGEDEADLGLSRRSSSRDGESEGASVPTLQSYAGHGEGVVRHTSCGSQVPHGAHIVEKRLIGGSKWDWWVVGGRWSNFFGDIYGDIIPADKIDWEQERDKITREANEQYDAFEKATEGLTLNHTWRELYETHGDDRRQEARELYNSQEWVKAANSCYRSLFITPEEYFKHEAGGREAFLTEKLSGVGVPYSFIDLDGEWHQKGEMGWFGISTDDKDQFDWAAIYFGYIDKVVKENPGSRVVSVDFHI